MEVIVIDSYKLDRISTRMAKDFGTIPRGREEDYAFILAAMEGNLLKLHRQDSKRTGRQALIAIKMALLKIDGYLKKVEYNFSQHETLDTRAYLNGLLMSFDPFTNKEIHEIIMKDGTPFEPKKYFATPIKCLLRIEKSIEHWTKRLGANGYFVFIEKHMGHMIDHDVKMNYSVKMPHIETRNFK
ncbi:hypothetical protein K0H71_20290 [Bacillus sp. IITD106]|nr:hypothetical protein [Bacillus sp. IITD106]